MIKCVVIVVCRVPIEFIGESQTVKFLNFARSTPSISLSRNPLDTHAHLNLLELALISISSVIGSQRVLQNVHVILHLAG